MQGLLNDSNRMTPYRNVEEPKWPNAFWQQLNAGLSGEEPPANTLAKEHPIATTSGYLGRRLAIDPLKYLGDVLGKFRDTGKMTAGDAAGFAMYGLGMGYPGGAPAGEEATVGTIKQAPLPFKPQLQTALENRALGKTYLGANPKGKVLAETLDRIGNNAVKDELAFSGAKGYMLNRAGRIGGDTGYKTLAGKVEDFGKNLRRTELTNLDTEYIDFSNFRSPHTHNYREVLYHHKDFPEFNAQHFSGTKIPSPSGGQLHPIKRYTETGKVYNEKLNEPVKIEANKGLMMHRRMGDIEHEGKNVSILEELQSDWRVKGDRQGFRDEREKYKKLVEGTNKDIERLRKETKRLMDNYIGASPNRKIEIRSKILKIGKERSDLLNTSIKQINKSHGNIPPMPYKEDWWKIMVNDSLDEAIKNGKDELWITTGEAQAKRNAPTASTGYKRLYNKNMLKYLKERYNIVPERVERQGLDYWRIPLDRIKEDMLLHMTKSQQLKGWRAV